ncbi:hypothetical protein BH10BAC1_BH10BAC1_15540 [soil metagenome]
MDEQKIHKEYMWYLQKLFSTLLFALFMQSLCLSQSIVKRFNPDSISFYKTYPVCAKNKAIPTEFDSVINIALAYYPELCETKIKFKVKRKMAPLSARPTLISAFRKPSKRKYIIFISKKSNPKFTPILLKNLSLNAKIGVIGHELSHLSEYQSKKSFFFVALAFKHLSKKSIDKFEYNTDRRCIDHNLGYQLLAWSTEVRQKLKMNKWGGANNPERERYMNPDTIQKIINASTN